MGGDRIKQVFYDGSRSRWRKYKFIFIVLFILSFLVFGVTAGSVFLGVKLPEISLGEPVQDYSEAFKGRNVNKTLPAIASTSSFAESDKITAGNIVNGTKFAAFYVNWDENSFSSLKKNIHNIDIFIPEWLHLGEDPGKLELNDSSAQEKVLEFVGNSGYSPDILPIVNNFNISTKQWDSNRVISFIATEQDRAKTVNSLLEFVKENKFSGITIDLENIPIDQQANLLVFMDSLSKSFHSNGLDVYQAIPLSNPEYDAKKLSQYVDRLILMSYDSSVPFSGPAGPIAPQQWILDSYKERLKEISSDKYIVALGGYGYDWYGEGYNGKPISFQETMHFSEKYGQKISLDKESLNPTFKYTDTEGVAHEVWYLDAVSFFNQIVAISGVDTPYAFALWRMGSEDPSVWGVAEDIENISISTLDKISHINFDYGIKYEGKGEVLKVTEKPKEGKRKISFNRNEGLIKSEEIVEYPSLYVIRRWGGDNPKKIALTFDDGPNKEYTPKILEILKNKRIKATFFVVGANANINTSMLKRISDEGHEVGNHTYTHPNVSVISEKQFKLELDVTQRLIESITGKKTLLFRPPYAEDVEPQTVDQIMPLRISDERGYYTVSMHIDPDDWDIVGGDLVAERVISDALSGDGNVVLLHDGGGKRGKTVEALPIIIDSLSEKGYEFVTVSELAGFSKGEGYFSSSSSSSLVALINRASFFSVKWGTLLLVFFFGLGIILGIAKFIFILFLALVQWVYTRNAEHKNFALEYSPKVSVIVPAFNEEKVISSTVDAILTSDYKNYDIVVVDDGSTDGTYEVVSERYGDNDKVSVYTKENGGKSTALNYGLERSDSELVITLDADTVFKKYTISKIIRRFIDRKIGAVAGNAKVGNRMNILTKWQALEYITSQNLDKRGFEVLNSVTVVPGAIGAWRRLVIEEAGGFSSDTMAEDADLTFSVIRNGHRVVFDDEAVAYTEAPDEVSAFLKQRFRWMYGTFQTAWKHKDTFFRRKYGFLGFVSIPNVFIFQIFFPIISPFMDLAMIFSVAWGLWQNSFGSSEFSSTGTLREIFFYYMFFLAIDFLTAIIPFALERKEKWSLLFWLPLQRFYYRQLMYYVAIKAVITAVRGSSVEWNKLKRKATVKAS